MQSNKTTPHTLTCQILSTLLSTIFSCIILSYLSLILSILCHRVCVREMVIMCDIISALLMMDTCNAVESGLITKVFY